jgi:hypothetical protein
MSKIRHRAGFQILLGLLLLSSSGPLSAGSAADDKAALIALYNDTNGDDWTDNTN